MCPIFERTNSIHNSGTDDCVEHTIRLFERGETLGLVFNSAWFRARGSTGWYTYYWWASTISERVGCTLIRDTNIVRRGMLFLEFFLGLFLDLRITSIQLDSILEFPPKELLPCWTESSVPWIGTNELSRPRAAQRYEE